MDAKEIRDLVNGAVRLSDLLADAGYPLRMLNVEEQLSCPFHGKDASPSARHYPQTNSMHCFTCKQSWDPVSFLMQKKDMRFRSAVEYLARRAGIDLPSFRESAFREAGKSLRERPAAKKGLTEQEKLGIAWNALESYLRSCRGVMPLEPYAKSMYLLSRMRDVGKWEEFKAPAEKLWVLVKKYSLLAEGP